MQIEQIEQQPTHFLKEQLSVKSTLLSILSIQVIFHFLAFIANMALTNTKLLNGIISNEGLMTFANDAWFLTVLVMVGVFVVTKYQKIEKLPLMVLLSVPLFLLLSSIARVASTWIILSLLLVASVVVVKGIFTVIEKQANEKQ